MNFLPVVATVALAAEITMFPFFGNTTIASHPLQPTLSFGSLGTTIKPTASPAPKIHETPITKKHYPIAALGDSMIDTLGADIPDLTSGLTTFFPNATFTLYNYGVGATNIDYGIERITRSYTYQGRTVPALLTIHPDIVIVESFGYNPYANGTKGLPQYRKQLANLIHILKTNLPGVSIVMAVTIAPDGTTFGDGAPGIAFSTEEKRSLTAIIKQYLKAAVDYAKNNHLPLADAYTASLTGSGDGDPMYVSVTDHIHYSAIGRMLLTQKIIEAIVTNHLIR